MLDYGLCRQCRVKEQITDLACDYDIEFNDSGKPIKIRVIAWTCPVVKDLVKKSEPPPENCIYLIEQLFYAEKKSEKKKQKRK